MPGAYAEVDWPLRRPAPTLFVPPTAIVQTTERTFVDRVRDGKVGAAPDLTMAILDGPARTPTHAGEKNAVHLDEMIEDRLLRLGEEAGDQRVPLRRSKALEVVDIVPPHHVSELADGLAVEAREVDGAAPTERRSSARSRYARIARGLASGGYCLSWNNIERRSRSATAISPSTAAQNSGDIRS